MRILPIVAIGAGLAVVAGGVSVTVVGASHQSKFATRAQSLEQQWDRYQAEGVPRTSLAPLRATLEESQYANAWWSPYWWGTTGQAVLDRLQAETDGAWSAAMSAARAQAEAQLSAWASMAKQFGGYVPAAATVSERTWPEAMSAAATPDALNALTTTWAAFVQQTAQQARTAQLDAQVAGEGGVHGLLSSAQQAVATGQRLQLDTGQVPALISQVQQAVAADTDASSQIEQLVSALAQLQSLIAYNDTVAAGFRPVMLLVDQAVAQGDPEGNTLFAQYQSESAALTSASTYAQLQSVQSGLRQLQSAVTTSLAGDSCGHDVGSGKVITINLTLQEAVFYDNGCVANATPVTTGRPGLRTPTGDFHVFYKTTPFEMVSPWPKGSPYYYYPTWVTWVMEFDAGGYFLHDAYWEPGWEYGPGSEDSSGASHGCIHIPTATMQWLYSWTPIGTPVIISS